jgi:hypothetical protein
VRYPALPPLASAGAGVLPLLLLELLPPRPLLTAGKVQGSPGQRTLHPLVRSAGHGPVGTKRSK